MTEDARKQATNSGISVQYCSAAVGSHEHVTGIVCGPTSSDTQKFQFLEENLINYGASLSTAPQSETLKGSDYDDSIETLFGLVFR